MPSTSRFALVLALVLAGSTAAAESLTAEEEELVALINQARVDAGLAALQVDAGLTTVARAHSLDMATTGFFSHSSPMTGDMGDRLGAASVDFQAAGENIAIDSSVRSAHDALFRSAPHRQNLLSSEVTHLGVGVVSNGRLLLVTEVFVRPGPRFVARIPTLSPVVAEASPDEVRQVPPSAEPGADSQVTIVPSAPTAVLPMAQQIPTLQVRPLPMPVPPSYPTVGRGTAWILGPRGTWVQVRIRPAPYQRRVPIPRSRFLY